MSADDARSGLGAKFTPDDDGPRLTELVLAEGHGGLPADRVALYVNAALAAERQRIDRLEAEIAALRGADKTEVSV